MNTHRTTFTASGFPAWTPVIVHGDAHKRQSRAIVHELLGESTPAVSFLPTLPRSGRLDIVASTPTSAAEGLALLSSARPITLTDIDRPDLNMRFIVSSEITQSTDPETQEVILMTVDFQEVPL